MELLVFGHAGAKVLVFPTRCGKFYQYEDMGVIQAVAPKIEEGQLQFYCLDSIDDESFYCFWCHPPDRVRRHLRYEDYILNEVFPLMESKNPNPCVISHGCSFGGYHAVNIALRHPHRFKKVVSFSGRFDLTEAIEDFRNLFDGHYDEHVYFNTPIHFIPNLSDEQQLQHLRAMDIVLAVGNEDPFLDSNHRLSTVLWDKGIWNALHIWSGRAHRARDWRKMAELYV
jgi:esterase/lipase superfamily enzyme